jgi:hypothetical protein
MVLAISWGRIMALSNSTAIRSFVYPDTGISGLFGKYVLLGNLLEVITNMPLANASWIGKESPLNFSGNTNTSPSLHKSSQLPIRYSILGSVVFSRGI